MCVCVCVERNGRAHTKINVYACNNHTHTHTKTTKKRFAAQLDYLLSLSLTYFSFFVNRQNITILVLQTKPETIRPLFSSILHQIVFLAKSNQNKKLRF